jgi:hypothetical protein
MAGLVPKPLSPTIAGRHARLRRSAGPRGVCLTTLIALVVQFVLGMILNLYATVPSSDAHAGYVQEMVNGPVILTVHVLLGIMLIGAAVVLLIRAVGGGNRVMAGLAATGLAAILGAFAAGDMFVRNGQTSLSLWMAIATGVALVCYIGALSLMRVAPGLATARPLLPANAPEPRSDDYWSVSRNRPTFPATGPRPYYGPPTARRDLPPWEGAARHSRESRTAPPPQLPSRKPPTNDFPQVATDDARGKRPWWETPSQEDTRRPPSEQFAPPRPGPGDDRGPARQGQPLPRQRQLQTPPQAQSPAARTPSYSVVTPAIESCAPAAGNTTR